LSEAVIGRIVESWDERLDYALELANSLINAHELDAQVLHRDISPKNILIENLYDPDAAKHMKIADFDLSWHKDADDMSIAFDVMNGYLAPEQLDMSRRKQCRNAYVDSFGFGMTLYFMLSRENPSMGEHKDKRVWREKLIKSAMLTRCKRWSSLPRRFARMIYFLTKDVQGQRWTMQDARNELLRLQSTFKGISTVNSAELFAEELIHRTKAHSNQYVWNKLQLSAEVEIKSGFGLRVMGDEGSKSVIIEVDWAHLGDAQLSTIQKYMPNKVRSVVGNMNKRGWRSEPISFSGGASRYSMDIPISKLKSSESLNAASEDIDRLIDAYKIR
jgi:serine/threonine protein kinase